MKCVICGNEVSKRKSYAYKEGRACKVHQEAQEHNETREKGKVEKRERDREKVNLKKKKWDVPPPGPRCFICGSGGIHQSVYYHRMLVNMQKVSDKTSNEAFFSLNPKDDNAFIERMRKEFKDKTIIFLG